MTPAPSKAPWKIVWLLGFIGLGGAMLIVFFAVEPPGESLEQASVVDPSAGSLALRVDRAGTLVRLWPESPVSAGDALRVDYRARGASHGVMLSRHGVGNVAVHFPKDQGSSALASDRGSFDEVTIPKDGAFSEFFFFTANSELDSEALAAAVAKLDDKAQLIPPKGVKHWSMWLSRK